MKAFLFLPLLCLGCFSPEKTEQSEQPLCGRYLLRAHGQPGNYLYHHQDTILEINPYKANGEYGDLTLMNDENKMIGVFYCDYDSSCTNRIFLEDISTGNHQTVFETEHDHYMSALSLSRDDSLVAFTYTKPGSMKNPPLYKTKYSTIYILDIANKRILYQVPTILASDPAYMAESNSWDPASARFVFTNGRIQPYDTIDYLFFLEQGVYIRDIKNDVLTSIATHGHNAIWSNSGESIAYMSDDQIVLYDVLDKKSGTIYVEKPGENINQIHWNPCTDNELYIVSWHTTNRLLKTGHTVEQVLNVNTGSLIQRKTVNIGENSISWMK